MSGTNRRSFLGLLMGGAGTAAGLAALGLPTLRRQNPAIPAPRDLASFTRRSFALGTQVNLTVLHADPRTAHAALGAAFAELAAVERTLSMYRPDSNVSRLNRDGRLVRPHPYFVEVLRAAQATARRSDGAFDVTVQPLWALHTAALHRKSEPTRAERAAARAKVDWRKLQVDEKEVRFTSPGMALTLNGIAQGYATDRVTATLKAHGIEHALIDTGELGGLGGKDRASTTPWRVGVQHPRIADAFVALVGLKGGCLATSGDYATSFSPDRAKHHIFDPHTGDSPADFASVSVVAVSGLEADALSTAAFAAGITRGSALIEATPGAEALFVTKGGRVFTTAGFPVEKS